MINRKTVYIILLALLVAVFVGLSLSLRSILFAGIDALAEFIAAHKFWGAVWFVAFAGMSVLLGPFTSSPLIPSAVAVWGNVQTLLFLFVGWLLGNSLAYLIGYRFGYPIVSKIVKKSSLDKWIEYASDKIPFSFAVLFRLATPSETGYVFGLLKYNFEKYLVATAIAEAPFAIFAVYASFSFLSHDWNQVFWYLLGWLGLMVVAVILFRYEVKHTESNRRNK